MARDHIRQNFRQSADDLLLDSFRPQIPALSRLAITPILRVAIPGLDEARSRPNVFARSHRGSMT